MVKSIFNKIFAANKDERTIDSQTSLPLPAFIENIHENQKRALIGWIANRLGQKLQMDVTGGLLYLSFTAKEPAFDTNDETEYLLYLASSLVEWTEQEYDVYLKIKEIRLSDDYHQSLLEIYEEIKNDIPLYLPAQHKSRKSAENDEVWQVYRDVIYAVTQRKFLLIQQDEVNKYKEGKVLCQANIVERSDIPKAREMAKQSLLGIGIPQTIVMSHLLVISEAITNILKHAQEGNMIIVESSSEIHVVVEDRGPGFPLKQLPNMTLMVGYSTKKSLGQGFTLMMKMTELILLSTIPDVGSTLILVFKRKEVEQNLEK